MRNLIATVITLLLCAAGWYVTVTPDLMVWLNAHWYVYSVLVFVVNFLVKLTTWKGDDSLWDWVKGQLLAKHK